MVDDKINSVFTRCVSAKGGNPMARVCDVVIRIAIWSKVSHSNRKRKRVWAPNIKRVRAIVDGSHKTINVCTRCLRSGKVERVLKKGFIYKASLLLDESLLTFISNV